MEKPPYRFKKSTSERYDFTQIKGGCAWAIITIDENGGLIGIQSDYGDWSYAWPRHGRESFKHFLVEMAKDEDYFLKKILRGVREVDNELIQKRAKEMVLDRRIPSWRKGLFALLTGNRGLSRSFDDQLTKEQAKDCWSEANDLGPYEKIDDLYYDIMHNQASMSELLFHDGDAHAIGEIAFTRHPFLAHRFFHEVYLVCFIPEIKKELGL